MDKTILGAIDCEGMAWTLDPIDGTVEFVRGGPDFGIMIALVTDGESVAAWMYRPTEESAVVAEHGAGLGSLKPTGGKGSLYRRGPRQYAARSVASRCGFKMSPG